MALKNRSSIVTSIQLLLLLFSGALYAQPNASFSVNQSSGCVPLTVQFNNTSTGAIAYHWDFGNGNYSTSQNPSNVYLNSGWYTVKLVAYGPGNTADSVTYQSFIHTVNPPAAAFTAAPRTTCQRGGSVTFTNNSAGFDSCFWDFGDGNTSTLINPVHQYNNAGSFNVTLITYNTTQGCLSSETKQNYITVNPAPVTSFTVNNNLTCDSTFAFQFTGSAAASWKWFFGDGATSTLQNPTHVYNQSGLFDVKLVEQNQFGCTDTLTKSALINIKLNPPPDLQIIGAPDSCAEVSVTLVTATPNIASYLWDFGDGTNSTYPGSLGHIYYSAGTYQPSLSVVYTNGCSNSTLAPVMNVYSNVPYGFNASGWAGCAPYNVTFTPLNTSPGMNYLWEFGDGTTSTQQNPTHTYTSTGNFNVTLKLTSAYGCYSEYMHPNVVQVQAIDASFAADDITGCIPHTVNFAYFGNSGLTYLWDFGDGTTSTLMSPSHTYTVSGNYPVSLSVINTAGCSSNWTMPFQVNVTDGVNNFNPAPVVTACAPFTINLFDNSPSTSSWLWDFGDGTTSTDQNPTHTYTTSGTFNVTLTTSSTGSNCSQFVSPYRTYIINGGVADFDVTQTVCPPYTATFTDQSVNAVAWFWDFGDGNTSTLQNPVHIYTAPGHYNVTLTITTADGCQFVKVHNYAVTFLPLTANATAVSLDSVPPMNVQFFANSTGATSWLWDFGDGGTSTQMNPQHIYLGWGPYDVTLTISNNGCTYTYFYNGVTIGAGAIIPGTPPDSLHAPDPVYSCIPYEMNFSNPVQSAVAWLWDFGDGDTSTVQNPDHIYTTAGTFTVTLITWDVNGDTDTIIQPDAIHLIGAEADFDLLYQNNCQGSAIVTSNLSTNAMSYLWDFGDGTTSTAFEPVHTYSTNGVNYIVSLTVTDSAGCTDFMSRSYYASVTNVLSASKRKACANDTVYFDSGTLNFASYLWDFGDGTTSSAANPYHIYPDSGSYQVSLAVTDTAGCTNVFAMPYTIKVSKPKAAFTHQMNITGCMPVSVQLTNLSSGADLWLWDFGNGITSTQLNPTPTYHHSTGGSYDITLIAYSGGCADTFRVVNAVEIPSLTADFSFVKSSECFPITVTYTDLSNDAVSWLWDFGDGTTSTQQHPVHTFSVDPTSKVKLTVFDTLGCQRMKQVPNISGMIPQFTVTDTMGCKPFQLVVSDSSTGVVAWSWDFGDGNTSTASSPQHYYTSTGNFNVMLTATAATGCTQVFNPAIRVTVTGPQANFASTSTVSCSPTVVNFNDLSTGAGQWMWDFGDGGQSVLKNPVHTYNLPGSYDISLVISDSIGCTDTLEIPDLIHITGTVADFDIGTTSGCSPFSVAFIDSSVSAFSWLWNFGDGDTSTLQNPSHLYTQPGTYTITLSTQDTTGCTSVWTNPVNVEINDPPVASFSTTDTIGCAPYTAQFIGTSTNAVQWAWDFGDGTTSALKNPLHTFSQPGVYTVTLIAFSAEGCSDTIVVDDLVKVGLTPQPAFTAGVQSGCPPLYVQLTNNTTNTVSGTQYFWDFGNGLTSLLTQPLANYNASGIYTVSLVAVNPYGCSAATTIPDFIQVTDNSPLPPVSLRSVSVVDTGAIDITWANLPAQRLASYDIFRWNPVSGQFNMIYSDVVPGNSGMNVTSVYRDSMLNTTDYSYTYVVRAVNTCGVATPLFALQSHSSVNVETALQGGKVLVNWNPYGGCGVDHYTVLRQDLPNNAFAVVATVNGATTKFIDSSLYCNGQVAYRILANDLCGLPFEAYSDTSVLEVPGMLTSQPVDVIRTTVVDDNYILTEWKPPVVLPQTVTGYEVYKSEDGINFTLIDVLPAVQTSYEDYDVDVHAGSYTYMIKVVNICELDPGMGRPGKSVWLQSELDDHNNTLLRWTYYLDWDTGVDYYVIERQEMSGSWRQIGTVPGNKTQFLDH